MKNSDSTHGARPASYKIQGIVGEAPSKHKKTLLTGQIDNSMVMKCVAYQNGVSIGDVTIEDISEVLQREHTFVWLGLREANSELLVKIQQEFGLHD
ncbi:MAG: hypothetical protein ACXWJB_12755, partial [Limisphaerales bacterium]